MDLQTFNSGSLVFCSHLLLILTIKVQVLVSYKAGCPMDICQCVHNVRDEVINCRQLHLSAVPPVKPSERQFKEISLRQNNIRILPKNAFKGIQTKILDISSNAISYIHPNAFEGLQNMLEVLRLGLYSMKDFPDSQLSQLHHLKELHITGCYLPSISKVFFSSFVQLNELHLSSCRISRIGEEAFTGIKESLVVLNLMANELTDIPSKSLKGFKKLKRLILSHNKIVSLPAKIFPPLSHVYHLDLSNNNINNINRAAFFNINSTLKFLGLQKNKLNENMFESVRNLSNLSRLEIGNNVIKSITQGSFINLNKLTFLDMQSNGMTEINNLAFEGIKKSLKVLICSGNPLKLIPVDLFLGFRHLTYLYLDNSYIGKSLKLNSFKGLEKTLETLNIQNSGMEFKNLKCLHNLSHLKVAQLSYNSIHFLPDFSFSGMKNLRRLDLTGNNLTYLSDNSLRGLEKTIRQIILKKNNINVISECIFLRFRVLRDIELGLNPLQCDCNLAWLMDWVNHHYGRYRKQALDWQCQTPLPLYKKYFRSLEKDDFKCTEPRRLTNICTTVLSRNMTSTAEGNIPINNVHHNFSSVKSPSVTIMNQNIEFKSPLELDISENISNETTKINPLHNTQGRGIYSVKEAETSDINQQQNFNKRKHSRNQTTVFQTHRSSITTAKLDNNFWQAKRFTTFSNKPINFHKTHTENKRSNNYGRPMASILQIESKKDPIEKKHNVRSHKKIKQNVLKRAGFTASTSPPKLSRNIALNKDSLIKKDNSFVELNSSTVIFGSKIIQAVQDDIKYFISPSTLNSIKLLDKNNTVSRRTKVRSLIDNHTVKLSKSTENVVDNDKFSYDNVDYNGDDTSYVDSSIYNGNISNHDSKEINDNMSNRNVTDTSSRWSIKVSTNSGTANKNNVSSVDGNSHQISKNLRSNRTSININKMLHNKPVSDAKWTMTKRISSINPVRLPTPTRPLFPREMATHLNTNVNLDAKKATLLVSQKINSHLLGESVEGSHKKPENSILFSSSAFENSSQNSTPTMLRTSFEKRYLNPSQLLISEGSVLLTTVASKEPVIETYAPFVLNSVTTTFPSSSLQGGLSKALRIPSMIFPQRKRFSLLTTSFPSLTTDIVRSADIYKIKNTSHNVSKTYDNLENLQSISNKSNNLEKILQNKQINNRSGTSVRDHKHIWINARTSVNYHSRLHSNESSTKSTKIDLFKFLSKNSERSFTPITLEAHNITISLSNKSSIKFIKATHSSEIPLQKNLIFPLFENSAHSKGNLARENHIISSLFLSTSHQARHKTVTSHKIGATKMMRESYRNLPSVTKTTDISHSTTPLSFITQLPKLNSSSINYYSTIKSDKIAFQSTNVGDDSNIGNIQAQKSNRFHIDNSKAEILNNTSMNNILDQSLSEDISLNPNSNNNYFTVNRLKERGNFNKSVMDNLISEEKRIDENKAYYERNYNLDTKSVKLSHTSTNESFENDESYINPTNHSNWRSNRNIRNVTQSFRIQKKKIELDNTKNSTSNVNLLPGKSFTLNMNSITNTHAIRRNESKDKFVPLEESKKSLKLKIMMEEERNISDIHMLPNNNTKPINRNSKQNRISNLQLLRIDRNSSFLVSFEVRWNVSLHQTSNITAFRVVSKRTNGSFDTVIETLLANCSVYHLSGIRSNNSHLLCVLGLFSNQTIFAESCDEIYATDLSPLILSSTIPPNVTHWNIKTLFGTYSLVFIIISVVGSLLLLLFSTFIILLSARLCKQFNRRKSKINECKTSKMAISSFGWDESFGSWSDVFFWAPMKGISPDHHMHNTTLSTLFYSSSEDLDTSEDSVSDITREKDEGINETSSTSSTFEDLDNLNKWVIAFQHDPLPIQKVWSISNCTYNLEV